MLSGLTRVCTEKEVPTTHTHTHRDKWRRLELQRDALIRADAERLHMRRCDGSNIKRAAMLKHFKQILFWLASGGVGAGSKQLEAALREESTPRFTPELSSRSRWGNTEDWGAGKWFNGLMQASLQTTSFFCFHNQHVSNTPILGRWAASFSFTKSSEVPVTPRYIRAWLNGRDPLPPLLPPPVQTHNIAGRRDAQHPTSIQAC